MSRRKKWMDLLFRSADRNDEKGTTGDPALGAAHAKAKKPLTDLLPVAERLTGALAHGKSALDALAERERRSMAARAEVTTATTRVREGLDRLGIVALNAGLEGARIEGPAGRALAMVADEIRQVAMRCTTASDEIVVAMRDGAAEAEKMTAAIADTREKLSTAAVDASTVVALAHATDSALGDLGDKLGKATGVDPEVAAALERAQAHARELVSALSLASSRGLVRGAALRPVLEPILRLFDQLDTGGEGDDE